MNQTFSIDRFGRLFRKQFSDNRGQLLANLGLLTGSLVIISLYIYSGLPKDANMWRILFFLIGWVGWYVFTVQQTTVLNEKEQAIPYLLLPASQVEKIGLIWLVSGLGFLVVYLLLLAGFDAVGVWYVNHREWSPEQLNRMRLMDSPLTIDSAFAEDTLKDVPIELWVFTVLLHPFTLAFALIVRRYSLPIVAVIAFALLVAGLMTNNFLLHNLMGLENMRSAPFVEGIAESPTHHYQYRMVKLPQPLGDQLRYVVGVVILILLYITAYLRLKEREV